MLVGFCKNICGEKNKFCDRIIFEKGHNISVRN
jgi:hypothetical protein